MRLPAPARADANGGPAWPPPATNTSKSALACDVVKLTESFPATQSRHLMEACAAMGLEGVIMKRKGSLYRPGYRSPDWIKVPIRHTEEFIVMGYLAASPNRLSSLILAQYDQRGKIAYAGLVGTGLSEEARGMLLAQLHALKRKTCLCAPAPRYFATTSGGCEPICHPSG